MDTLDYLHITPYPPERIRALMGIRPYVRQTGDQIRRPWKLPQRRLLDHLLVYIGSGRGFFRLDRKGYDVGPGDIFHIPPDTLHEMRGLEVMECIYIHFDLIYHPEKSHWDASIPGYVERLGTARVLVDKDADDPLLCLPVGRMSLPNHDRIRLLMKQTCTAHAALGPEGMLILSGLMTMVIGEILRFSSHDNRVSPAVWLGMEKAVRIIREQIRGPLNLKPVHAATGYSPSHFRKLFRRLYGQSPREMHTALQMQKAREMLIFDSLNISEIADYLGFSTVQNFSRAFLAATGNRPLSYRRQVLQSPLTAC